MKGTIKYINQQPDVSLAHGTFKKYKVTFDDGKEYSFLAKQEFKKQVGETIEYEITNEKYQTAKLSYVQPSVTPNKDQLIIRQSMVKAACDFHANRPQSNVHNVLLDAQLLINFVNE